MTQETREAAFARYQTASNEQPSTEPAQPSEAGQAAAAEPAKPDLTSRPAGAPLDQAPAAAGEAEGEKVEVKPAEEPAPEDEDHDDPAQPVEKRLSRWERRIQKLNRKATDGEQRALAAERRAMEAELALHRYMQPREAPPAQADPARRPEVEDFETYGEFTAALARHEARALLQQEREQARVSEVLGGYQRRLASFKETTPDFDVVFNSMDQQLQASIPPVLAQATLESEVGPQVAYHFAKHQGELRRLLQLPPHRQLMELAVLEQRLMKPALAPASPPPAKPPAQLAKPPVEVGGGGAPVQATLENTTDYLEWKRLREAKLRRR